MNSPTMHLRQEMRRYLRSVPDATPDEIADLKEWVEAGNNPYCNPFHIADDHGQELPYIQGLRAEHELYEIAKDGLVNLPEPSPESGLF